MICGARLDGYRPRIVAATAPLPDPSPSDLRHLCNYVDNQGQTEKCVGEALSNAHWIATRGAGKRVSPVGIYRGARVRERIRKTDPLPDMGSNPADAIDAMIATGVYAIDLDDVDPSKIGDVDTWEEMAGSQTCGMDDFSPIEQGDVDTIDRWLSAGYGVVHALEIDASFQSYSSGVWQGTSGTPQGGHETVLVGGDCASFYWLWNSWGKSWGQSGFMQVARDVVRNLSQMPVCVKGGPVL